VKPILLPIDEPKAIPTASDMIRAGGLVAFPTDTVYGLAADLRNEKAINNLFAAKGREMNKAIAVLVGSVEQLEEITPGLSEPAKILAARFWPGALTLVVSRRHELPDVLSVLPTIGVRMPDHAFAIRFLTQVGPLAVTSANISGADNPLSAMDVLEQLGGKVDLILDGGRCPGGIPSTVVDCTVPDVKILRQGAIPSEEILRAVGGL